MPLVCLALPGRLAVVLSTRGETKGVGGGRGDRDVDVVTVEGASGEDVEDGLARCAVGGVVIEFRDVGFALGQVAVAAEPLGEDVAQCVVAVEETPARRAGGGVMAVFV